ncbi:MAG: S8 family serine peptidase [Eubacterium sp.]|nr:S8 family serine peptidase [Eubacterium sp.]
MNRNKRLVFFLILALVLPYAQTAPVRTEADVIADTRAGEAEWNIRSIRAESSYEESRKGKKIRVVLLDSGVDVDEDIPCEERRDFLDGKEEERSMLFDDVSGHGTAIAGLICARENEDRITGLAANVELYSARVLDEENQAPASRIARAVWWAIEQKADIIHMSLGTDQPSPELERAVKEADRKGILMVAAAGNAGTPAEGESTVEYPAAYEEVLAVGATDTENNYAAWSSGGPATDLAAPGDRILSTGVFGGIVVESGTSLAAAHVTGAAAALWGRDRTKSSRFIRTLLTKSANRSVAGTGYAQGETAGLLDYTRAKENYDTMNLAYTGLKSRGVPDRHAVGIASEGIRGSRQDTAPEEEINYVNGSWEKGKHQSIIKKGKSGLSDEDIRLVKKAAVISDELPGLKEMAKHPCFHGGGNYIADTEYLYYLSKSYKKGKALPKYTTVFTKDMKAYEGVKKNADIRKELKKTTLNRLFKACGVSSKSKKKRDEKKRRLVFLGVAVHNATDALSHRAYKWFKAYKKGKGEKKKDCYDWGPIVHPDRAIKNMGKKGRSVEAVWKDLRNDTKDKEVEEQDQNQKGKIINYEKLANELAIADQLKRKGKKKAMPKELVTLADRVAKELVGKWKNGIGKRSNKKPLLTKNCWEKALRKGVGKIKKKVALAELDRYWEEVTGKDKKWKLNHDLDAVALPELGVSNLDRAGKTATESVKFTGNQTSRYIAYTKTGKKKPKRLNVDKPVAEDENTSKEIQVTISSKKGNITQDLVMVTAYRNLRFKVQAVELSRKISYETKKLEKNIKKVKKSDYKTVTQNIWDHRKKGYKIPKKVKYTTKEKGKKQAGYILNPSKKGKKGPKKKLGAKIPWGVGTKIVLHPYFAKQPKKKKSKK